MRWACASFGIAVLSSNTLALAEDAAPHEVEIRGSSFSVQRAIGDVRVTREELEASPHEQTSELLSAAPGFFVDHEDGEGLGNDVYLRGFDLDHGSGIEMRLGPLPINQPTHVQGQGYADANFIIPEVVQSVRVLEGCYDPRQNDSAIVGSAYFELGVPERGYRLKTSYGSFDQRRVLGIVAPEGLRDDTFVAFAARKTDGFGSHRASESASLNASAGASLGDGNQLRVIATAHGARSELPGVVREDDVNAGRIGFYDSYPHFAENQSIKSARITLSAELLHSGKRGARFAFAPWLMWTDFRARQNYTGALETSQQNPRDSGLGDLFETKNRENAAGFSAYQRSAPLPLGPHVEAVVEPGAVVRLGRSEQAKSLLEPMSLVVWDRRLDARVTTLDVGAYLDVDLRIWKRLRLVGGARADFLAVNVLDRLQYQSSPEGSGLSGSTRRAAGVAAGPRVTLELEPVKNWVLSSSYGEGLRSLDAAHLQDGETAPYSKVRSVELGMRAHDASNQYTTTLAMFRTWVENELVFVAEEGGLETERASTRSGVVGSFLARPTSWFLGSAALSVTSAEFDTRVPGVSHHVPSVPPLLFHSEASLRGALGLLSEKAIEGRLGVGYTFLSGRHLSDTKLGPSTHALNVSGKLRRDWLEIGLDVYNALARRYADSADVYISNWSLAPGQQRASVGTHFVAAPPTSVLGSLTLYL